MLAGAAVRSATLAAGGGRRENRPGMTIGEAAQGAGAEPPQAAWAGLVGRSDVLAQLGRAVGDAAGGRGRLVLLTGEAGIGKTSVAAQAAADAEGAGARVVWGWGWQGEGAPAYWPWVQVLRSLLARDRRLQRQAADAPRWPGSCPSCRGRPTRRPPPTSRPRPGSGCWTRSPRCCWPPPRTGRWW
jgi:hypothetical protein